MSTWSGIRNKLESDYLCPALMVSTFAVTGGKILDVTPECRAQVVTFQFVSDSAPG